MTAVEQTTDDAIELGDVQRLRLVPGDIHDGGLSLAVLTPRPDDIIELATSLSDEEFEEFRRRWTAEHGTKS